MCQNVSNDNAIFEEEEVILVVLLVEACWYHTSLMFVHIQYRV